MQNSHIAQINFANHCIELAGQNVHFIHSALYRLVSKVQEFEKEDKSKMVLEKVVKATQI